MEFKKFSCGYHSYGTGHRPKELQQPNVNFDDPVFYDELNKGYDGGNYAEITDVLLCMALCHTVILDQKKGMYTSASPDELALVYAAKQFGYEFLGMSSD